MVNLYARPKALENGIFQPEIHAIAALLEPKTIAVFGATHEAGSVGNTLLRNLITSPFFGHVFSINGAGDRILDVETYGQIQAVPEAVDLAIIATPLSIVPGILADCVAAGVKTALVISPGFRESGAIGRHLEAQLRDSLSLGGMRLLGPNSLGVMNPRRGLNATLTRTMARPGNIAFISQSGALCRAVLDWSFHENVGFSAFISLGSMLDVDWGDLISYLGDDPYTQSIVIHMESLGDARSFLRAAREVASIKPIILLKGGRTEAAVQAAIAHTGDQIGADDGFAAALRRCGVLQVNRISELFNMAEVLAKRRFQPQGNRLAILTNSGGLGILALDALVATGGQPSQLTPHTLATLDGVLPSDWSRSNPIDLLGDADGDRYRQALEIVVQDPNTDGVLVILAPQGVADPTDTAEKLKDVVNRLQATELGHKPILASWVGGAEVMAGEAILNRYQIPTYPYPDSAARLFNLMGHHSDCLQGLYVVPSGEVVAGERPPDRDRAQRLIDTAQRHHRNTLTTPETHALLAAYGLPSRLLEREAHNLAQAGAYGFRLTSDWDPHYGPVMRFGWGTQTWPWGSATVGLSGGEAEVALPPLDEGLAQQWLSQSPLYPYLTGAGDSAGVNLAVLRRVLVRFSHLVAEQPWIRCLHLDPLALWPQDTDRAAGILAAVVDLHPRDGHSVAPQPLLRPYRQDWVQTVALADGSTVTLRPVCPSDESMLGALHQQLTHPGDPDGYPYYPHLLALNGQGATAQITRLCFADGDRTHVLVAERPHPQTGIPEIKAVGRVQTTGATGRLTLAVDGTIAGLGAALVAHLVTVAKSTGLSHLQAPAGDRPELADLWQGASFHLDPTAPEPLWVLRP